ncbi:MAG: POTRA domain-containing protein [Bacteroidota bacterium]
MIRHLMLLVFISLFNMPLQAQTAPDSAIIIRDIQIRGNSTTKEQVILREMSLKIGDTLTQQAKDLDRNNIYNLRLFNKVDITDSVYQNQATIIVTVSERWYFVPFPVLGMKYRDLSKLYYGAGMMHENFRGRNQKLFALMYFGYDQLFMINYQNPKATDDDDIFIGTALTLQKLHNLSSTSEEYMNSNLFLRGTVGKRFGMYQTLSSNVGYELWQVSDPRLNSTSSSSGRDAFLTLSLSYRFDTRNNNEYTTNGTLASLTLLKNGFGESDVNITAAYYDFRKFFGFNGESTFGLRTAGSFAWGGVIPSYRHVFFGYDERIRGYFYKKIEAENKISASIELRLPILLPRYLEIDWFGVPEFQKLRYGMYFGIFADAGKAWSRSQVLSEQPWYSGYGAGLQFLLPYGFTIRTEVALNNLGNTDYIIDFDTSF